MLHVVIKTNWNTVKNITNLYEYEKKSIIEFCFGYLKQSSN